MRHDFPKTLLLTRWSPGARYAGGEYMRKMLSGLPVDRIRWAYTGRRLETPIVGMPISSAIIPETMHWRIQGTTWDFIRKHYWAVNKAPHAITEWISNEGIELLWIASDLETIPMGLELARTMSVRTHLTVFDAFENCTLFGVPRLYQAMYQIVVGRLLNLIESFDAISEELVAHLEAEYPRLKHIPHAVLPSSVAYDLVSTTVRKEPYWADETRKIAFCGAPRFTTDQWQYFLGLLNMLPWKFEIHSFASETLGQVPAGGNIKVRQLPYADTEADMIRYFAENRMDACYLGLWKEVRYSLFVQTSLSSKLTTYLASGIPVIADVPEKSAAWNLIGQYRAGVRLTDGATQDLAILRVLFGESTFHRCASEQAICLCREHFLLSVNIRKLEAILMGNCRKA